MTDQQNTSDAGPAPAPDQAQAIPQPVAYDQQGRPLYAAPPSFLMQQPQPVYITRAVDPGATEVPAEVKQRHEQSRKQYPQLNLSEGEYIITAINRHPFGIFQIWFIALGLIAAFMALLFGFLGMSADGGGGIDVDAIMPAVIGVLGLLFIFVLVGAVVASYVYNNNRFYLTNESVIQEIQNSIFSKHEQTVSLANIEDASYMQNGILPAMFNFGLIRLSTEGDETTYRFNYVSNPKAVIATLNNAVESFKNYRRVEH